MSDNTDGTCGLITAGAGGSRARCAWTSASGSLNGERRSTGEHLVENRSKRVQVCAAVHQALGAAGLLRRNIGERALELAGNARFLRERRYRRRRLEVDQPYLLAEHEIVGAQVAMDDASVVNLADDLGHVDGEVEEFAGVERSALQALEEVSWPGVFEHQGEHAFEGDELKRPNDPSYVVEAEVEARARAGAARRCGGSADRDDRLSVSRAAGPRSAEHGRRRSGVQKDLTRLGIHG